MICGYLWRVVEVVVADDGFLRKNHVGGDVDVHEAQPPIHVAAVAHVWVVFLVGGLLEHLQPSRLIARSISMTITCDIISRVSSGRRRNSFTIAVSSCSCTYKCSNRSAPRSLAGSGGV
jgi:hypothetical protein